MGGRGEDVFCPQLYLGEKAVVVGGRGCHYVDLVVFYQELESLLQAGEGFAVAVTHGVPVYVDDGSLSAFLPIVNPAYYGHDAVHEALVCHAVLSVEVGRLPVVLSEEVKGVYRGVFVAEESPHPALLLLAVGLGEALLGHLAVFLHQGLGHDEFLYAIRPGVLEHLFPHHAMLMHGVGHLESRIHTNAIISIEHFGIHAAHGSADDEMRLLFLAHAAQQVHGLLRVYGQVVGCHRGLWECVLYALHRARPRRGAEAVHVEYLLARHQVGVLFHVRIAFHLAQCLFPRRYAFFPYSAPPGQG